jgi:hypothetical protein
LQNRLFGGDVGGCFGLSGAIDPRERIERHVDCGLEFGLRRQCAARLHGRRWAALDKLGHPFAARLEGVDEDLAGDGRQFDLERAVGGNLAAAGN